MKDLILLVVGAIVGWWLGKFFDGFGKARGRFHPEALGEALANRTRGRVSQEAHESVCIGYLRTRMFMFDGDGEHEYDRKSLVSLLGEAAPACPEDIADRIALKTEALARENAERRVETWNGVGVGLAEFRNLRSERNLDTGGRARKAERPFLSAHVAFYRTRYSEFLATVAEIGKEDRADPNSIYQKHLLGRDPRDLAPYLARHVGVAAVVVTKDGQLVTARRHARTGARPGEIDVSFVEGIDPVKDAKDDYSQAVSLLAAVQRGCREELGFQPKDEQIHILGFGVDLDFYQFNFLVLVRSDMTYDEIATLRNGRARDGWESSISPLRHDMGEVLEFLRDERMWSTAMVAYYWSLTRTFGPDFVEVQARGVFSARAVLNYREGAPA